MKWQKGATEVDISKITFDRTTRQRQPGEVLDVSDIQGSIFKYGLFNPVIINEEFVLQAGERRLTACRNLGHTKILARKISDLTPVEAQIIELEENIKRQDLGWQDLCTGIAQIHSLFEQLDEDWTQEKTAIECGLTQSMVSQYLSVYAERGEERVWKASTVMEARNMLARRAQRNAGQALEDLLGTPDIAMVQPEPLTEEEGREIAALKELGQPLPPHLVERTKLRAVQAPQVVFPESIIEESFLAWAPQYTGPKFNFVHCDFPYGVELFSGPQGRGAELGHAGKLGYKDSVDTYRSLIQCFCTNLNRFLSNSAHVMFWLSADHRIIEQTVRTFNELAPSLSFQKFPLIWVKSDNAGIASDPRHGPRHIYEACLLASRGSRQIARVKGDAYSAPTNKDLHPSTKPEPMLRHFMEMLVDDTTTMLDPTCGSGASLRAAESLGAKRVFGLEIDKQYIDPARLALKQARQKRAAEGAGGA